MVEPDRAIAAVGLRAASEQTSQGGRRHGAKIEWKPCCGSCLGRGSLRDVTKPVELFEKRQVQTTRGFFR